MLRRRHYRLLILIILMVAGGLQLQAQPYIIQGTIENAEEGRVFLASYYGDSFTIVDSLQSESGFFYFMLGEEVPAGIYRIIYTTRENGVLNENRFVEFIFNKENFELVVTVGAQGPEPVFQNSLENEVYTQFMAYELEYESAIMGLYSRLYRQQPGACDSVTADEYDALQRDRARFMDSLSARYPGLYAVRIMNAFRSPFIPGSMTHQERIDTLKISFFDQARIDDPALLYAPVYNFKLIDYLSLFKVDTLTLFEQEMEFITAVDQIMDHVSSEPGLREFVVDFLMEGFEMLGMEQVQVHLADHYLDETCETDVAELVRERMEGYRQMSPGRYAPDFVVMDVQGSSHRLSMLERPYVLVVFWASSCIHCRETLPELLEWYQDENDIGLEVIAISIDTSTVAFERYMAQLQPDWITAHDPLGWNGRIASQYFVYATPTMFLLDPYRKILARPGNFRQFLRAVGKLEKARPLETIPQQ
ncbi:MAG: thioredoxin-like domain-containing protein [Bacteroidales bacterium]